MEMKLIEEFAAKLVKFPDTNLDKLVLNNLKFFPKRTFDSVRHKIYREYQKFMQN